MLEEFSPKLVNIKGENNIIADALSHLNKVELIKAKRPKLEKLAELYALDDEDLPADEFPITKENKIVMPKALQLRVEHWYQNVRICARMYTK